MESLSQPYQDTLRLMEGIARNLDSLTTFVQVDLVDAIFGLSKILGELIKQKRRSANKRVVVTVTAL